ncbi:hypothetical protein M422DRAFT_221228 [Sphaerobolus stellatus SS14]|nr:hypothetical protein M422DRAFT_221228 [Sphaerobolus stellatus SS14]
MSSPVKLYVYDLSNGLARQLSLQLTGKQIDGIWHTSVVVFGKEVFYGQGITTTLPGRSHHGQPLQVLDMGETSLDEGTFNEYLNEIRDHYTADKYHLLEFNCNSFTNDCVGFLTGGSIPSWIKELPQEFLSTPFGQALRPTIDNMYRRPTAAPTAPPAASSMDLSTSLLQAVAARAGPPPSGSSSTETLTTPIHIATNPASFNSNLTSHRCVVAFFTSATCAPCKIVEPVFEQLAENNAGKGRVAFVKVDMGVGLGNAVAGGFGVTATPTFLFFLDGNKVAEVKGADSGELRTQVNLLLFTAFPPHPHTSKSYPATRAISLNPILFAQPPNWDAALNKFISFIDAAPSSEFDKEKAKVKDVLTSQVGPFLKARFPPPNANANANGTNGTTKITPSPSLLQAWSLLTSTLVAKSPLPAHELFPLVDFWRVALLDEKVSNWVAAGAEELQGVRGGKGVDVVEVVLRRVGGVLEQEGSGAGKERNLLLTTLRMLANCFANPVLARHVLSPYAPSGNANSPRTLLTSVLIPTLLHSDTQVRTAAASLVFNIAAFLQKPLLQAVERENRGDGVRRWEVNGEDNAGDGDWEVEVVSGVVEAVGREANEDVVHRLTASLALFLHLSPHWSQLHSFVEVLGVKDMLEGKIKAKDGVVKKEEVKKLVKEVARMCDGA